MKVGEMAVRTRWRSLPSTRVSIAPRSRATRRRGPVSALYGLPPSSSLRRLESLHHSDAQPPRQKRTTPSRRSPKPDTHSDEPRPSTCGSPPNSRCQKAWLMTAPALQVALSSAALSVRPNSAPTPSTRKKLPLTNIPCAKRGSPPLVRSKGDTLQAIISENAFCCARRTSHCVYVKFALRVFHIPARAESLFQSPRLTARDPSRAAVSNAWRSPTEK